MHISVGSEEERRAEVAVKWHCKPSRLQLKRWGVCAEPFFTAGSGPFLELAQNNSRVRQSDRW